jgi:hypothetical protein
MQVQAKYQRRNLPNLDFPYSPSTQGLTWEQVFVPVYPFWQKNLGPPAQIRFGDTPTLKTWFCSILNCHRISFGIFSLLPFSSTASKDTLLFRGINFQNTKVLTTIKDYYRLLQTITDYY